jgi:predicted membrane protein
MAPVKLPKSLVTRWAIGSAVALSAIYYGLARAARALPSLTEILSRPIAHPHALVSAFLLIALWTKALHSTMSTPLLFWYKTLLLWALVALAFVGIRMVMVLNPEPYNPASFWWSALLRPPVGVALLLAVLNSFLVAGVVALVFNALTTRRKREKYARLLAPLLLKINVLTLCVTFVALLCIFPSTAQNV